MTYYSDYAEFYDYVIASSEHDDSGFFVECAVKAGGPVLDLGCGTGRVLIPMAQAGIEAVGLEAEPAMLDICRKKLEGEPVEVRERITLLQGDMANFDLDRKFSLIMIPFRSFHHMMTPEAQLSCLECVHRHLADDGIFVLDIFNPYLPYLIDDWYLEEQEPESDFVMPDGRKVVRKSRIVTRDLVNQTLGREIVYYVTYPGGREERKVGEFGVRYIFFFEAQHLLARAGFCVDTIYFDYNKSSLISNEPEEFIFVANKIL